MTNPRRLRVFVASPGGCLTGLFRLPAAGEQIHGALAGSIHHALVAGDGAELIGDVGEVESAAVPDGVLQGFEFGIEAEAVVQDLDVETAPFLEGKGDGFEVVDHMLEGGIAGPDKLARAAAVRTGVGERFVAGEGEGGLRGGAARGKEAVFAGVAEEIGAEGVVEADGAIEGRGHHVVAGVGVRPGFGSEVAGAGFIEGEGVLRGLKLRMLEGENDAGGGGGGLRRSESRDGEKQEEQKGWERRESHD